MSNFKKHFTVKKIVAESIFMGGFVSAMYFWQVSIEKIGLFDYFIGIVIYALCSVVSKAMMEDKD